MMKRLPTFFYLLIAIVLSGLVLIGIFRAGFDLILFDPLQTPETWCINQPCFNMVDFIIMGDFIINQPTSTILVYLLALFTIGIGIYFIKTQNNQQTRFWWGISLILTGIGAGLAGTSYQAFGYEIKCRGLEYCIWTSWWEVAYMICTMAGAGAAFIGVAYAILSNQQRKFWSMYTLISTSVYVITLLIGTITSTAFLISFELMIVFCLVGGFIIFIQTLRQYRIKKESEILQVLSVWIVLVVVIMIYYVALMSGFASLLWEQGIWFNENDVLHILMIGGIFYIYKVLGKNLIDLESIRL
jgi:hypothetical protein